VERPAAQYRGRYQERLDDARALLEQAGTTKDGSSEEPPDGGGSSHGAELPDVGDAVTEPHAGERAITAVDEAKKYLGTPYLWGGSNPKTGFDCSGLVQWAYAKAGIQIPRVTYDQIDAPGAVAVDRRHLIPGDLVFFSNSRAGVHHVGMFLGGDKFIQAPHTADVVKISSLDEPYYAREFAGGRRFDPPADPGAADPQHHTSAVLAAELRDRERAVEAAQAALDRDAEELRHANTALFRALERQERGKGRPG
jgi:cell wall-associated NlpC family hydrolase